jgi:hypothetical protein
VDADPEPQRIDGARLADGIIQSFEVLGRPEIEPVRIALPE